MGYENRQDIPVKYTWDLSAIYPNETLLEKDCAAAGELIGKIKNYEGKLNNEKSIYEFFELTGDIEELFEKAICYTHMKMDEDSKNTDVQAMRDKVLSNYNKYSVATSCSPSLAGLTKRLWTKSCLSRSSKNTITPCAESKREKRTCFPPRRKSCSQTRAK